MKVRINSEPRKSRAAKVTSPSAIHVTVAISAFHCYTNTSNKRQTIVITLEQCIKQWNYVLKNNKRVTSPSAIQITVATSAFHCSANTSNKRQTIVITLELCIKRWNYVSKNSKSNLSRCYTSNYCYICLPLCHQYQQQTTNVSNNNGPMS